MIWTLNPGKSIEVVKLYRTGAGFYFHSLKILIGIHKEFVLLQVFSLELENLTIWSTIQLYIFGTAGIGDIGKTHHGIDNGIALWLRNQTLGTTPSLDLQA